MRHIVNHFLSEEFSFGWSMITNSISEQPMTIKHRQTRQVNGKERPFQQEFAGWGSKYLSITGTKVIGNKGS
jgi:hypothetical protein